MAGALPSAPEIDLWELIPDMDMENLFNPGPSGVGSWTQGWDVKISAADFGPGTDKLEIYVSQRFLPPRYTRHVHDVSYREGNAVQVVPHSHNDPGWKETFEGWYTQKTGRVLDTMVQALAKDPRRRFQWSEVAFIQRWWQVLTSIPHSNSTSTSTRA